MPRGKKSATRAERIRHAAAPLKSAGKFYVKGNRVFCRNRELLFAGDPPTDAPETVMLEAFPIEGDDNALTAREVARVVADALNKVHAT